MVCHYRDYFNQDPRQIKLRLQVTANPIIRHEDMDKVGIGVVNPKMAMCDPSKIWLAKRGARLGEETDCGRVVKSMEWCNFDLGGTTDDSEQKRVNSEQIHRIIAINKPSGQSSWVIYKTNNADMNVSDYWRLGYLGPLSMDVSQKIVKVTYENGASQKSLPLPTSAI